MDLNEEQIKLVNLVGQFYCKPQHTASALLYSTKDVFQRLQSVYTSEKYTEEDIYVVLTYLEFETINSTTHRQIMWYVQEQQ